MAVQHSLHDDLNLSYSKRENVEAKSSLSRRRRRLQEEGLCDDARARPVGGWYGMGWVVLLLVELDNKQRRRRRRRHTFRFASSELSLLLLFSSILLLVYSYRVSQSLSLSNFFLSIFEFFLLFWGKGNFSSTRGACCVDSRACFPYAWSVFYLSVLRRVVWGWFYD